MNGYYKSIKKSILDAIIVNPSTQMNIVSLLSKQWEVLGMMNERKNAKS
jgi:hypothetical protein